MSVLIGDCREVMATMDPASVDAVVTDPPYELGFMGKDWDKAGVAFDPGTWREALRVLKPGGHLLSFGGTRTFHRMAVAIEDAGFEIRDCLSWLYATGFPKSLDVSKAIDKAAGVEGSYGGPKTDAHAGWIKRGAMRGDDGHEGYQRPWMDDAAAVDRNARAYIPATQESHEWAGWGTALKPAWEPVIVARKPLIGTVAANVLAHGTGALNIDACRIDYQSDNDKASATPQGKVTSKPSAAIGAEPDAGRNLGRIEFDRPALIGRWPANVALDETAAELLGAPSRFMYCAKASRSERNAGLDGMPVRRTGVGDERPSGGMNERLNKGSVYRQNHHPTVKPIALMRWLVRLVTPPEGIVLDPFAGSGSTGVACAHEGVRFIGIEQNDEYAEIARRRIEHVAPLFSMAAD